MKCQDATTLTMRVQAGCQVFITANCVEKPSDRTTTVPMSDRWNTPVRKTASTVKFTETDKYFTEKGRLLQRNNLP